MSDVDRVVRKPELEALTGLTERSVRDMERADRFPRRFPLNPPNGRAVGWKLSEVQRWLEERAAVR